MQKLMCFVALVVFVVFSQTSVMAGDLDGFKDQRGLIKIAGGTAHIPVMKEAAKNIMTSNPQVRITIAGGGSGVGIKQAGEGLVNIGNAGRAPSEKEIESYGLSVTRWAVDGVAVVVNPENKVSNLTSEQLQAIYAGETTNWKELGGVDRAINIYSREDASGTRSVFWKKAISKGDIIDSVNIVASNGAMKTTVGNDPYSIGYVSVGHIDESVKPMALDGVEPSLENVRDGKYTVSRGLYSVTQGAPEGLNKLFLEYILSPEGQEIAQAKGFIAVN